MNQLSHLIIVNSFIAIINKAYSCTAQFHKYTDITHIRLDCERIKIQTNTCEYQEMSESMQVEEDQEIIEEGENQDQQDECYEQQYDYGYDMDDVNLSRNLSKDQPYSIYQIEQLLRKIWEQIADKTTVCAMSNGWTLMLYYFTDFNSNYFDDLIDQDQTGRNIIKYSQAYTVTPLMGECAVCLSETQLFNNPCGHSFCKDCWKFHITINHTDRNVYELFPLCQQEGCYERTNFHLMEFLWQEDQSIKSNFQKLLCLKYSLKSIRVKICPNQVCGKAIYMNSVIESIVVCECGTQLCRHCGYSAHWPLQCVDLKNWQSMVNDKDNQWINKLVTQKCPMCKQTIQKNEGCIHMTCVCKYQFCWICMKVWKGHTNYYQCLSVKKDDFQKKLKQQQKKKSLDQNYYNQRFEEAKGEVERLTLSTKRLSKTNLQGLLKRLQGVQVLKIHSDVLAELKVFILKAWDLIYRCTIYSFFEREQFKELRRVIFRLNKGANQVDDFIFERLPKEFKESDERASKNVQLSQVQRVNMKSYFLKGKQELNAKARQGLRIIELIKKEEYSEALKQVCNQKSSLYIDQQPQFLIKKQVKEEQEEGEKGEEGQNQW